MLIVHSKVEVKIGGFFKLSVINPGIFLEPFLPTAIYAILFFDGLQKRLGKPRSMGLLC